MPPFRLLFALVACACGPAVAAPSQPASPPSEQSTQDAVNSAVESAAAAVEAASEEGAEEGEVRGPLLVRKRTVEVRLPRQRARVVGPVEGDIAKALASGDGARLAILWEEQKPNGERLGRLDVWDTRSNTRQGRLEGMRWAQGMAWRPQGDALAWCDWEREDIGDANGGVIKRTGFVWLWDGRSAEPRKIVVPGRKMFSVAFTRDGRRVVAACGDMRVRVWNYASGKLERTVRGEMSAAEYAAKLSASTSRSTSRRRRR